MYVRIVACLIAFAVTHPVAPAAGEIRPPQGIVVDGVELVKNGYGRRSVMWIDVYECALYLPRRSRSVGYATDPSTPAAIRIEVLYSEVPETMPTGWRDAIRSEVSARAFRRLKRAYRNLEEGDVLLFAYAPGNGTKISVNGDHILTDRGHGLMAELLEQWIGALPVSEDLRTALIGRRERW